MTNREEFEFFELGSYKMKTAFQESKAFYLAECVQGKPTAKGSMILSVLYYCFNHW